MTSKRPKIAIVACEVAHPRFLAFFEALKDEFDCCLYSLHTKDLVDRHCTGIKLRLFDPIPDMPGYLRGLEDELASADAIIGLETSRLATFQAVRAARKHGIPLGVVVNEFHPFFYERFTNIRAIQFDICHKADRFWATSEAAAQTLRLDNVPEAMIRIVRPVVNVHRFQPSVAGRAKFRGYVGLNEGDFVVLYQQDLEAWNKPEQALLALDLVRRQAGPAARRIKLLIVGNGAQTMDLKYRSVDLQLGSSVMFLHQDPEPFLHDLYAATDAVLVPRPTRTEFHEELPLPMLEAMATGAVPIVPIGSVAAELAGPIATTYQDDTHTHIGAALQRLAMDPVVFERARAAAVQHIRRENVPASVATALIADVRELLGIETAQNQSRPALDQIVKDAAVDIRDGREREALVKLEEALITSAQAQATRATLLCLKGEALYALGDIEPATAALSESLKLDDRAPRTLRGLGFVAWQGHSNEEALMFFKKAHAMQDDDAETMLGIGLVYRRLGLTEEALFWLEKCMSHEPYPKAALAALTQTCAQATRPELGIRALERVMEVVGEHKTVMLTLGQLYMNEGQVEVGNAMLRKAMDGGSAAS